MRKGFTLIELLIVIGILAILSTAAVLILNPAEIIKEARDVQRISDLKALKNAIEFYLARATQPILNPGNCELGLTGVGHDWVASANYTAGGNPQNLPRGRQPFTKPVDASNQPKPSKLVDPVNVRKVDGSGWVPIPFIDIPDSVPISKLPIDPLNDGLENYTHPTKPGFYYSYQCQGLEYEVNANMESAKYATDPVFLADPQSVENKDGGIVGCSGASAVTSDRCNLGKAEIIYEIGNDQGLDL